MIELMYGSKIEAELLGTVKKMPCYLVSRKDFTEYYEKECLGQVEGIYFCHDTSNGLRALIYKGQVVGTVNARSGNITWYDKPRSWEMVYKPVELPKKNKVGTFTVENSVFKMETKIPQPYKANGGIDDVRYIDSIMNKLLAEGEAFRASLQKGDSNG